MKRLISNFFPFYCLHCHQVIEQRGLCSGCFDEIRPISCEGRCRVCFSAIFKDTLCRECKEQAGQYCSVSLFPDNGPSCSLVKHLAQGSVYALKLIFFFLRQQLENLSWKPDMICSFHHLFSSKEKTAYYVGKQLSLKIRKPLKKVWYKPFFLRKIFLKQCYEKKIILLICERKTLFLEEAVRDIVKQSKSSFYLLSLIGS